MYGIPSGLAYDLAAAVREEQIARADRARLIKSAGGQHGSRPFLAVRRAIGAALIAAGHSVHGKRAEVHDHSTVPSTGALRLAR